MKYIKTPKYRKISAKDLALMFMSEDQFINVKITWENNNKEVSTLKGNISSLKTIEWLVNNGFMEAVL